MIYHSLTTLYTKTNNKIFVDIGDDNFYKINLSIKEFNENLKDKNKKLKLPIDNKINQHYLYFENQ